MNANEERLTVRLRYEKGLAACSRALITGGRGAVEQALRHLLEAAQASRVYIFETFQDPSEGRCWRQIHEACAQGVEPQIDNPGLRHLTAAPYDELTRTLDRGEAFWGLTAGMSDSLRALLEPQGILSILLIPFRVGGEAFGFIGFDDTGTARSWSEEDMRLLGIGAEMIGVHMGSQRSLLELADRQSRLDSIFRAVPVGIAVVHGRTFAEVNDPLCRMSGYARQELVGMSTRILYGTQEEFEGMGSRLRALSGPYETVSVEGRLVRKDGSPLEVLLSGSLILPQGTLRAATFTLVDITALKRAEEERRRLEAQAQEVRRLESIGVLAGGIAHDFNNLLMAILGNVELSLPDLPPDSKVRESLQDIALSARKAADLTRQLLDYSGRSRVVRRPEDLSAVVREAMGDLAAVVGPKAQVSFDLADGLPPSAIDPGQILQMIRSLLANSSDAAVGDRVDIAVRTGAARLDGAALSSCILGSTVRPGPYLYVEVSDTGSGMDGATVSRLFEPFYTTRFQGRGLGLAAVLGITRVHAGCIGVESTPGKGTTIRVHLPAVEA